MSLILAHYLTFSPFLLRHMLQSCRSRSGPITCSIAAKRKEFLKNKFPDHPGHRPDQLPRSGSHGGQFFNPSTPPQPLTSSPLSKTYTKFISGLTEEAEKATISRFKFSDDKAQALEAGCEAVEKVKRFAEQAEDLKLGRIKGLKDFSYNKVHAHQSAEVTRSGFRFPVDPKGRPRLDDLKATADEEHEEFEESQHSDEDEESEDKLYSDQNEDSQLPFATADLTDRHLPPPASAELIKSSCFGKTWKFLGAQNFVSLYNTAVPAAFHSALSEYRTAKTRSVVFDESFRGVFELSGTDFKIVGDHFLAANLHRLKPGESQYSIILDSKGLILDICDVVMGADSVTVVTGSGGAAFQRVYDYISQYVLYSGDSGLVSRLSRVKLGSILSVQGPEASRILAGVLKNSMCHVFGVPLSKLPQEGLEEVISAMPVGAAIATGFSPLIFRRTQTGLDGYTIVLPDSLDLITSHPINTLITSSTPAGLHAMDMLRMHAGMPRPGVDVTSLINPVGASLIATLDQAKLRAHSQLGYKQIFGDLARGPTYRRVGIALGRYAHAGCKVYSADRRQVGMLTSCAWIPELSLRMCQGYVKPEYARVGKPLLVNVPLDLPDGLKRSEMQRFLKQGMARSTHRKLVCAQVVGFPLTNKVFGLSDGREESGRVITHAGRVPFIKGSKRPNPTLTMRRQEALARRSRAAGEVEEARIGEDVVNID